METRGKTFVVSGPSGVGKSTVLKALLEERRGSVFLCLRHHPGSQTR